MQYIIVITAALVLLPMQLHAQQTWHVYPGQSIQTAINNASSGDHVVVHSEISRGYTYYESIGLKSGVSVYSVDYEADVIIDGQDADQTVYFTGNGQGMEFGKPNEGFLIRGGAEAGARFESCQNLETNYLDIESGGLIGLHLKNCDSGVELHNTDVHDITSAGYAGAVYIEDSDVLMTVTNVHNVYGPAVNVDGGAAEFTHLTATNCHWGIYSMEAAIDCQDASFTNCSLAGAKMLGSGCSLILTGGYFLNCATGVYMAFVNPAAHIEATDCEFHQSTLAMELRRTTGFVEDARFFDIYDTGIWAYDGNGSLLELHDLQFDGVDGIGVDLVGALASVQGAFDGVLGTAISASSIVGSEIISCDVNGAGGCFEGISSPGAYDSGVRIRDCTIRNYDFTGGLPIPRGVYVELNPITGMDVDLGVSPNDGGGSSFTNTGKDVIYTGPEGTPPENLYAQLNWWGVPRPDPLVHFGGRFRDYIVYLPCLPQPPSAQRPTNRDSTVQVSPTLAVDARFPGSDVKIHYGVPEPTHVDLIVWDMAGRAVNTLIRGDAPAGARSVTWDGTDARGEAVASGVYLCRLSGSFGSTTRRFVLVR